MKKLKVTIKLEMEIPDDWELVKHPCGNQALKIGESEFLDMTFLPMVTHSATDDAEWTDTYSDEFANEVLDMVQAEDVTMKHVVN